MPAFGNPVEISAVECSADLPASQSMNRMHSMSLGVGSLQRSRIKWQPLPRSDAHATLSIKKKRELEPARVEDLPDLLHPEPRYMLDRELLQSQLAFSFAGGDASDNLKR